MSKPIVVEVTKTGTDWPKGAELGYESEAQARKALGDGAFKVLRHQDGSPVETKTASRSATTAQDEPKRGDKG